MIGIGFLSRQLARELRGVARRLVAFVLCLAVGVAAVVIVATISRSLDSGIRLEARNLLAADLAVSGSRPPTDAVLSTIDGWTGSRRTSLREMVTIVAAAPAAPTPMDQPRDGIAPVSGVPPRTLLVELKVVDGPYPFYGALELDPQGPLAPLLGDDGVVVAPDLLARLGVAVGDRLLIGGQPFTIRGRVLLEPDRIGGAFTLGPRVFLSAAGLARTALVDVGSRVQHAVLVELPAATTREGLHARAAELRAIATRADGYRVETYDQAQPALRRGLDRLQHYLGLIALLSLLVGGVGVGQAIRVWIAGRSDSIAILKCLGLRPREVFLLYLGQAAMLGLVGSVAGCALGFGIASVLPFFLRGVVPTEMLDPWQPIALVRGMALGLGTTMVFAVPPLTQVLRVAPARVLRQNAEPLPGSRALTLLCAIVLIAGTATLTTIQAGDALLAAQFSAALAGTVALLAGAAWVLTRAVRRLPRGGGRVWLRHGLASLGRPGAAALSAIVAIGLGLLVVFATQQVQSQLGARMSEEIPKDAPSAFFADVQPDQWEPIRKLLDQSGATDVVSVPVVVARVRAVDGKPIAKLVEEGGGGGGGRQWALTREQRLTYLEKLPAGNRIVAGELWVDPARHELSLDQEFAGDLGAHLGSIVEFDVQGVPMTFVVTSLRTVDWESFGLNFFIVVEPGALENAPQVRIATAKLPRGHEQSIQDQVVAAFPNVTVVMVHDVLDRIVKLLRRLSWGISFLGAFTLVAGLVILAATIGVESSRRGREVALLKTLGMRRAGVAALFATEYALLGLVAGVIGVGGGGLVAWIAITRAMELPWRSDPAAFALAITGAVVLSVVAGAGASAGALRRRPAEVLRSE